MSAIRWVGRTWNRFWFTPTSTATMAVFRIGYGTVAFLWALALLPNLRTFFSTHGIEPAPVGVTWGILGHYTEDTALYVLYGALVVSALCVIIGYRTRLASVVLFLMVFSFIERAPSIFNSGDGLVRNLAFFLVFMPAGDALSVDRWRTDRDGSWEFPTRAPWALRLVQLQVSLLYLSSVYYKLHEGGWTNGAALSYVWRMDDLARFHVPGFFAHSPTLSTIVAFLTLVIEAMLGVLIWVRSARPLVLGLGVALHLTIDLTLRIGFFSVAIMASYVAFLAPEVAGSLVARVRLAIGGRGRAYVERYPSELDALTGTRLHDPFEPGPTTNAAEVVA